MIVCIPQNTNRFRRCLHVTRACRSKRKHGSIPSLDADIVDVPPVDTDIVRIPCHVEEALNGYTRSADGKASVSSRARVMVALKQRLQSDVRIRNQVPPAWHELESELS